MQSYEALSQSHRGGQSRVTSQTSWVPPWWKDTLLSSGPTSMGPAIPEFNVQAPWLLEAYPGLL